ncbi:unnamed protein product [Lampetra planeri]
MGAQVLVSDSFHNGKAHGCALHNRAAGSTGPRGGAGVGGGGEEEETSNARSAPVIRSFPRCSSNVPARAVQWRRGEVREGRRQIDG